MIVFRVFGDGHQTQRVWQESEAQLLQQIANQLAIAIQQVTIFEQLQQQLSDRNPELAIANQDLSRATRLKGEFLANMSHELRTPLNVILGFAQILNADPSLQAQQREYIRIMQRSGDHLLHLINDILDLSKIEANRITLEPENIDFLSLLYDLQAMFQARAEDKDLAFNLALASDLPQYIMTPGQGSSFRFTLPLRLAEAADVAVAENLGSVIGLAPGQPTYRMLVVDDQLENRYFLVAALS